jgi:CAAX prenyl protease-like protein
MTRKPAFWILLTVVSAASALFSWQFFTGAFSLLTVDIRMDRQGALDRARALASERSIGPQEFRDAASFSLDETAQTFVELEGGGKAAFGALVVDRLFTPYRWRVRHFVERERHEATFSFAPDGTPDGFVERLPEDEPGAALAEAAARTIAESAAARVWSADLSPFRPIEHSQEQRIGGRVDHTFVYELPDRRLGEGRFRLRLAVSGDRLTELTYFLKIPDAFNRRYDEMRSANTAIGIGGSLAFLVVYGVGGIAIGLFFLMRSRWVIWRQPIVWGAVVAGAQTLVTINEWPLAWMRYDTALSTRSFIAQQAASTAAELVVNVILFSLSFMAAESLTRRAFPSHPQFWRLWGRASAPSREVLGRTAAAYLLMPAFVAYDVALYLFATKSLGWWTPSEALFNPDVLAAHWPWFSAIARSFQAGFWEESLFRAVPIAGAALIGDRLGNRRAWIIGAFVVQAAIFGSGHAPYPTQPAYARPVELVIPSIAFGLLYLAFGLLPGIVLHFAFDTFWFAIPLFASSAAGIRTQQALVVAAALVPLWIVLVRRAQTGRWIDLGADEFNAAWRPAAIVPHAAAPQPALPAAALTPARARLVTIAGLVAGLVWIAAASRLPVERHTLRASRTQAVDAARTALAFAHLGTNWRFLPVPTGGGGAAHAFVWKTAGRSTYESLLGTYLALPGWTVLVRTFEGDVAERAEEWIVSIDADGAVQDIGHKLPESRPGKALDAAAARTLAERTLAQHFDIHPGSLRDVSASPSKLPARTDWTITFADTARPLPRGEARLSAHISGDEAAGTHRFVYVPEEWERTERNARTASSIAQVAGLLIAGGMLLGGVIAAIISWSRRRFRVGLFLSVFILFLALTGVRLANIFPTLMAGLSTSQPLRLQLVLLIGSSIVGLALLSASTALIAGAAPVWSAASQRLNPRRAIEVGIALGALAAAAGALAALVGVNAPAWPSYTGAGSYVPLLAAAIGPVVFMAGAAIVLQLVPPAIDWITAGWTRRHVLAIALLWLIGGLLGAPASPDNVLPWIASAVLMGGLLVAAYLLVLRDDVTVVPWAVAVMTTASTLHEGWLRAYAGALPGAIAAVLAVWGVAYWWFRMLRAPSPQEVYADR